jgi:hypothetical protein
MVKQETFSGEGCQRATQGGKDGKDGQGGKD